MDIIPGRENSQPQVEKTERSAKTESEEKVVERPNFRRHSEPVRHLKPKKSRLKLFSIIAGVVIILAIAVSAFLFFNQANTGANIESNKFQAVFFTNGQVYFGKLHTLNNDYMKLTNIYYLQAKTDTSSEYQKTATDPNASDVTVVKLGSEIHGPEDAMIISKSQILFFENLKSDGRVSSVIIDYEKK